MHNNIQIKDVVSSAELKDFIMFPWQIYRQDKNWVAPLIIDQKKLLDEHKNPFCQHARMKHFLALKDGAIAGRISAIINDNHNEFHNEKTGFFGFYESIEDPQASQALFDAAESWLRESGMDRMRGPVNPSTNDTCGLLIDAFDQPPVIMMTYNPEYYAQLFEGAGLEKSKDLYAYYLEASFMNIKRYERVVERIRKRQKVIIRSLDMKRFYDEVDLVKEIYNEAWEKNWGFIPMTDPEMTHMAKELKPVVVPDLTLFAMVEGQAVGFALALPDMNQALARINGRLLPFGLPKLLWYGRKVNMLRIIITGLRKDFRKTGIDAIFYYEIQKRAAKRKIFSAELSWVLEDNQEMRRAIENMGAYHYKTYRIYDKII